MNPYFPGAAVIQPPTPPANPAQRMEQLRDLLKAGYGAISETIYALDGHARSRRYKDLQKTAEALAARSKEAQAQLDELDQLMTAADKARRGL